MYKPSQQPRSLPAIRRDGQRATRAAEAARPYGGRVGLLGVFLSAALVASASAFSASCPYLPWEEYQGTKLLRLPDESAYIYHTLHVQIDADGAPNAYHPHDAGLDCRMGVGFKGLDCLANAGYPDSDWWPSVLVADPTNPDRAYVQPSPGEFAGFFVSQTALEDVSKAVTDPGRYVDSRKIPYVVFPRRFHSKAGTGEMGDLGYAFNPANGRQSPFVVAEIGPAVPVDADLGEMSIALAEAMGGYRPNPRTGEGSPRGEIVYVVFPKSGADHKWPLTRERLKSLADELLAGAGGAESVLECRKGL